MLAKCSEVICDWTDGFMLSLKTLLDFHLELYILVHCQSHFYSTSLSDRYSIVIFHRLLIVISLYRGGGGQWRNGEFDK